MQALIVKIVFVLILDKVSFNRSIAKAEEDDSDTKLRPEVKLVDAIS